MARRLSTLAVMSALGLIAVGAAGWAAREKSADLRRSCPGGVLSVASAGDIMMGSDLGPARRAAADTAPLLRASHVALGSLSMTLLERPREADPRGPVGGRRHADQLHDWGFTVVSRANDHVADFGRDGVEATGRLLGRAGLASAGVGGDLAAARAPVWLETPCGRVAVIAATSTLRGEDPATPTRPGIAGRPGANPLRYSTRLELDPQTYRALSEQAVRLGGAPPDADGRLRVLGATLEPGERNVAIRTVDGADQAAILAQVREARKTAALVIVSIHSHEPDNASLEPAPFIEAFARAAIDAGAGLVVGQGPHRLRPLEFHGNGLIAYSLGDFVSDRRVAASLSANPFDAARTSEGAVLTAAFRGGRIRSARLHALDLSAGEDVAAGFPRLARDGSAQSAIAGLIRQSGARGARLVVRDGAAEISPATPTGRPS